MSCRPSRETPNTWPTPRHPGGEASPPANREPDALNSQSTELEATLSLQLYSLRDVGGADASCAVAREAGFQLVEPYGGLMASPGELKTSLKTHGLVAPTAHVGIEGLRDDLRRVTAICKDIGITQVFMPAFGDGERTGSDADWSARGEELGRMADELAEQDIRLGYHNHHWEFESTGERAALEALFDGASGSALNWQADIAWIARAGQDPIAWMDRYKNLLASVHVKDLAPEGENLDEDGWCDLGQGTMDWPKLWNHARKLGAIPMVVEHDKPARPAEFARSAKNYLSDFKA